MRVAHLIGADRSPGPDVGRQVVAVVAGGGTCSVIRVRGARVDELEVDAIGGSAPRSAPAGGGIGPRAARALYRHLREHPVDVIHTHDPASALHGRIVGGLAGVPLFVTTAHGPATGAGARRRASSVDSLLGAIAARVSDARLEPADDEADARHVEIVMDTYRRLARERGLSSLLPTAPGAEIRIRRAVPGDARALAGLHAEIATGFLPTLGPRFLTRLYRALIAWPEADVWVAEDDVSPLGFVASVESTGRFYKHFALRHAIPAGSSVAPRLARPSVVKRILETFRHGIGGGAGGAEAELFSIATSAEARGKGLGGRLLAQAVQGYRQRGLERVRVVVAADNRASLTAHRSAGFRDADEIEVHAGEASKVLVWTA